MENTGDFILAVLVKESGVHVMTSGTLSVGEIMSASGQAVGAICQAGTSLIAQMVSDGRITAEMGDWYADLFKAASQVDTDSKMTFGFADSTPPQEGGEGKDNA